MRIFVAGATGTLGRPVVKTLVAHGHDVVGLSRSESGARRIEAMGARAVVGNALDHEKMRSLIVDARPEQVLHLLTALPPGGVIRNKQLRPTNELRTRGTQNLIRASAAAGVRRIVAESFVGVYGLGTLAGFASEDKPLPPVGEGSFADTIGALRSLEEQLRTAQAQLGMQTVSLRIGLVYGPDVPSTQLMIDQARAGRLYLPRGLDGIGSFVHIDDAATAIVAAVERPNVSPVYNVGDDEPIAMTEFLSRLAEAVSAGRPRSIPLWVVKLAAPVIAELGSAKLLMANEKAKRELGWTLRYPTLRAGLATLQRSAGTRAA
jgi:nucleoside-diphosphate-sugar epimerase